MNRSIRTALAAAMLVAVCGAAQAGLKSNVPVTVENNPQGHAFRAYGMVGTARNSADGNQVIGCGISAVGTGSAGAVCEAQNSGGRYVRCITYNAAMVSAAQAVEADSYIEFTFDTQENCTSIYVANSASNAVKQP
ncbi:hypothetical protein [Lysobacter antibioticus]|uniref:hypothetical protein n=1 Tax=Lysobacter antibioticus TaxID=84531 RepID=UPI0003482EDB|nr:hypothetical protein [Lysobacter antibioticus]